jgi:hypothetical protein
VTLVVVLVSKFAEGAWVMILLVPALLALFRAVHAHYQTVGREVATNEPLDAEGLEPPLVLVPIRGWSAITRKALRLALKLSSEIYALHIAGDERAMVALEDGWETLVRQPAKAAHLPAPKLIVIYSPYRRLYAPLKEVVSDLQRTHPGRDVAVIVPELVGTRWYHYVLHNQTATLIKAYLRLSGFRRVVVINVPWYLAG